MRKKYTVCFDFDGVIHSYTSGWKGETIIPDPPVPGIGEAIKSIRDAGYEIAVFSTRCMTKAGREAVRAYLDDNNIKVDKISAYKPPAIVYIDDRAICFDGRPQTLLSKIQNFVPWTDVIVTFKYTYDDGRHKCQNTIYHDDSDSFVADIYEDMGSPEWFDPSCIKEIKEARLGG